LGTGTAEDGPYADFPFNDRTWRVGLYVTHRLYDAEPFSENQIDRDQAKGEIAGLRSTLRWANQKYEDAVRRRGLATYVEPPPTYSQRGANALHDPDPSRHGTAMHDDNETEKLKKFVEFKEKQIADEKKRKEDEAFERRELEERQRKEQEERRNKEIADKAITEYELRK
jgi:hypothetical protein